MCLCFRLQTPHIGEVAVVWSLGKCNCFECKWSQSIVEMGRLGKEKSAERKAKKTNEHMERVSTSVVTNKPLKSTQRLNSTKKLSTLTNLHYTFLSFLKN